MDDFNVKEKSVESENLILDKENTNFIDSGDDFVQQNIGLFINEVVSFSTKQKNKTNDTFEHPNISTSNTFCAKCNKTFSFPTAASFKRHIESVHEGKRPYKCDHCELRFEEKSKMKNHVSVVHDKQKSFNCGSCDAKFATKTNLKEHICQYKSG